MKARNLKEFLVGQEGAIEGQGSGGQNDRTLPPPSGIIEVIHATSRGISLNSQKEVLSVVSPSEMKASNQLDKRP